MTNPARAQTGYRVEGAFGMDPKAIFKGSRRNAPMVMTIVTLTKDGVVPGSQRRDATV